MSKIIKKEITKETDKKIKTDDKPWYKRWYIIMTICIVIFMSIFNYNFTLVMISGDSMEPNFHDGNILLGDRHYNYIDRNDVVVINSKEAGKILIKRVIGLPGDHIEYKDNQLWVNGEYATDIYSKGYTNSFIIDVPEDSYFCLGDNRENSWDSRKYGSFESKDILAKLKVKQYTKLTFNN